MSFDGGDLGTEAFVGDDDINNDGGQRPSGKILKLTRRKRVADVQVKRDHAWFVACAGKYSKLLLPTEHII